MKPSHATTNPPHAVDMDTKRPNHKVSLAGMGQIFIQLIWPRRIILLFGLVMIAANRLSGLVLPAAGGYLIDDVIQKQDDEQLYMLLGVVMGAVVVQAATAFGLTALTAYSMMFTKAGLKPGQSVLITGIGGGVATARGEECGRFRVRR